MTKKMLIDASHAEETRVVVLDGNRLEDFDVETATRKQIKGNIYLAKVIRVEPSLQAAFVEYGGNRHGFLAFGEIHPDYYQIPVADRQRLLALQAEAAEEEAETDDGPAPEASADLIAAAPEGAAAEPEPDLAPEHSVAQALDITAIEIIAAPPPDSEEPDAPPSVAEEPEAAANAAFLDPSDRLDAAEGNAESLVATDIAESSDPEGSEAASPGEEPESNGEYLPPQPPPENLGGDGDDAAEARERRQRQRFLRNYKIQEVIHRRQIMLIQVVKEERGNKGAALTTYLSLAGRFSVLMPNSPTGGGVSRKITSLADRRRLKEAVAELEIPGGMGLIVRTAGANRPKPEIKRDCEYLLRLWDDIRDRTLQSVAPALIYEEASLIKRTIRDVYTRDVDDVYVDGEEGFRAAQDFMRMLMPSHAKKVQLWTEGQPLFAKYQVEAQLDAMLNPIVQLRSGGYIVINQTEALVSIDVNSGRSTRERSIEDTALRTNVEAAEEVARQLRMRDLAGLVVIDFIDMESRKNNATVERRLKDSLKNDRARIQVGSISHFGLMEMSRQRLRPSLAEASLITCPHCAGMGQVRSPESAALHILRAIEDEGAKFRAAEILVTLPPDVALYLFNHKRDRLSAIETRYTMRVIFSGDASLTAANFRIEKTRAHTGPAPAISAPQAAPEPRKAPRHQPEPIQAEAYAESEADDETADTVEAAPSSGTGEEDDRPRRRRRRRRGRRTEPGTSQPDSAEGTEPVSEPGAAPQAEWAPQADGLPTEMDLILAAELGDPADPDIGEGSAPEDLAALGLIDPDTLEPQAAPDSGDAVEKPARRRRSRGGRRRSATEPAAEGEPGSDQPPAQAEIVYADIADIFEAAERAEAELRVKTHLAVAPEPELPVEVHVPQAVFEPAAHAVFEPVESEPEAEHAVAQPSLAEPLVKPTVIGADLDPAEKKRGWWRR